VSALSSIESEEAAGSTEPWGKRTNYRHLDAWDLTIRSAARTDVDRLTS